MSVVVQNAKELEPAPPCRTCPIRGRCRQICHPVEEILPSMERGRVDAEDLPRLYMGIQLTKALLDNMHLLTPRQQEVVRLYYRESMRQQDIAAILSVTQQAVHDTLQRARNTIGSALKAVSLANRAVNEVNEANANSGQVPSNGSNGSSNGSTDPSGPPEARRDRFRF